MPRIQWMGNQDWNKDYPEVDLPGQAQRIEMPANKMRVSIIYGILPFLLCLACLYLKKALYGEFPFDKPYVFVGILLGFCLIPVHELLHAVCCPPDSVAYYGISLNKFSAFCVCHYPMSRKRAIVMSLLPAILGIIPLILKKGDCHVTPPCNTGDHSTYPVLRFPHFMEDPFRHLLGGCRLWPAFPVTGLYGRPLHSQAGSETGIYPIQQFRLVLV